MRTVLRARVILAAAALGLGACDNMQHQKNSRADDPSAFFPDGASARVPPAHTVARGAPAPGDPLAGGRRDGEWLATIPLAVDRALLDRGRDRYTIFCADCHGADGYGRGIIVLRGFPAPRSFHEPDSRAESPGKIFEAISRGSGAMYGFGDRIPARDRWALVAFIRALQRSQDATLADVPASERERLAAP